MEVIELLKKRKSVRKYTDEPITEQEKRMINEAALQAPSAGNMELYSIISIEDQSIREKLADLCDHQSFIAKAKMVLVFVADYTKWMQMFQIADCQHDSLGESDLILALEDSAIAASNCVIAAESLGIGSCFIGDIMENYEQVSELLHLPKYAMPLVMVVFGRPDPSQINRQKPKRFDYSDMVFHNYYPERNQDEIIEVFQRQTNLQGSELTDYIKRFYKRKMDAPFSKEMIRSVKVMLEKWTKKE